MKCEACGADLKPIDEPCLEVWVCTSCNHHVEVGGEG